MSKTVKMDELYGAFIKRPAMTEQTWKEREAQGDVDLRRIPVPAIAHHGNVDDSQDGWTVTDVHIDATKYVKVLTSDHATMTVLKTAWSDWKIQLIRIHI